VIYRVLMTLGVLMMGFLGGVCSQMFMPSVVSAYENLRGARVDITDAQGNVRGDFVGTSNGGGMIDLYGYDGNLRLQMAVYEAAGERGLPLIGLTDNNQHLKLLFRLAGSNESPVAIFKDSMGRDRIVMGLDLNNPDAEPFLAYFDKDGGKHLVFGNY
jgi:hypothetical protein